MFTAEFTPVLIIAALLVAAGVGWLRSRRGRESALDQMRSRTTAAPDVLAQVRALSARGKKLEAIRALRAATGMGLAEAKTTVEQLAAGGLAIPVKTAAAELPADIDVTVRGLLRRGEKIEAIRLVRESTGLDLKDSKDFVDRLEQGRY